VGSQKEKVVKEKVDKEKEDKEKEKISVKEKVKNIEKKVSDNAEKEKKISDSNQVKRMKIQRDNMEKKLNKVNEDKVELKAEIEELKEELEDLKIINSGILKDHHKVCHERNKLDHFCEDKGWKKSKVDEFNRYKETYQKCVCGAKD
jgi:predicted  nucleic acid-binding Zn-ribbon protein